MTPARLAMALVLAGAILAAQKSDAPKSAAENSAAEKSEERSGEKLAPYLPTPQAIVERMLQLGELKQGEKMYDLGSGDGRIVIQAARKYKADAFGVELDNSLVKQSTERIRTLGL